MGYGFKTGSGGGATGAKLTVNATAGCTVTVSKDGKTKTKVADSSGVAVFKGLSTGEWTITMTDGVQTSTPKTETITADYETTLTFFSATINVTYPAGYVCTATDGVNTLTAPDTSGSWECVVPNEGTWNIECVAGSYAMSESVIIDTVGQNANVELKYYIFKDGNSNAFYGCHDSEYSQTHAYVSGNVIDLYHAGSGYLFFRTANTFDVTAFKRLTFLVAYSACTQEGSNGTTYYGTGGGPDPHEFTAFTSVYTQTQFNYYVTVDISQLTGLNYIKIQNNRNTYYDDAIRISEIYLS